MRRRRLPPEPPPDWLVNYSPAEWITAGDLDDPPRWPAGAPMPLETAAYRRFMDAAREWLAAHDYEIADALVVVRAARRRARGWGP